MKTYIYFVRHAQPDISIKEDLIRPLTEQGIEDAKKVTKVLMNKISLQNNEGVMD